MNKLNFIDIFDEKIEIENEKNVKLSKIVIPRIQRDYAQGRTDAQRVRKRFLDAIYDAITNKPITLDFIYGDIDDKGVMHPLDGQQRLTTLFLLHWYVVKKEKIPKEEYDFLNKFTYETRYSSRDFCEKLVSFEPKFSTSKLSEEIENQYWFALSWKKDPTIKSMLVMLDCISEKFKDVNNIWEKLKNNAITFYFLALSDIGLTDELYIKMNSRGKPLTRFENFKAELENELKTVDEELSNTIIKKIDIEWTDLLWKYGKSFGIIDDKFLNYFRFICDIICYKKGKRSIKKEVDELDIVKELFSANNKDIIENIKLVEKFFDCWVEVSKKEKISDFFERFVSNKHEVGKIKVESNTDFFNDIIVYSKTNARTIMLYSFITYLLNQDKVTEEQFRRRIRIINNLVINSKDEMSEREEENGGNRLPNIIKQVDSIIINGKIDEELDNNFNTNQLIEEKNKLEWTRQNADKSEKLFELEDNEYLKGQIAIVGLYNYQLFDRFIKLFKCNLDKIDCALMATGNYIQHHNGFVYQLGSKRIKIDEKNDAWLQLFHKSRNTNFDKTKEVLISLLNREENINDEFLDTVKREYIESCEEKNIYDFRYYYIKYDVFRPGESGKYWWRDYSGKNYELLVMVTPTIVSDNAYQPFLKAIDKNDRISKDDYYNNRIIEEKFNIFVTNNAYILKDKETDDIIEEIYIEQNENGIDTEDRISKIKKFLYGDDIEIDNDNCKKSDLLQNRENKEKMYEEAIEIISSKLNKIFIIKENINNFKNLYVSKDNKEIIKISWSKKLDDGNYDYWYEHRKNLYESFKDFDKFSIAYICGNTDNIILVPISLIENNKEFLDSTQERFYHIRIKKENNKYMLLLNNKEKIDITEYKIT